MIQIFDFFLKVFYRFLNVKKDTNEDLLGNAGGGGAGAGFDELKGEGKLPLKSKKIGKLKKNLAKFFKN